MSKTIDQFSDVYLESSNLVDAILNGTQQAEVLRLKAQEKRQDGHREALLDFALSASMQSVNALLAMSAARCRRDAPPADIELVTDTTGQLIYRCQHKTPHKWKLDGSQI